VKTMAAVLRPTKKKRGQLRPLPSKETPKSDFCREGSFVERGVFRFEFLHGRDAFNEPGHDLFDLWIHFPGVNLRIFFRFPQADGHRFLFFRCDQQQLIVVLPAKTGHLS
jgi:hypothetical protein